MSRPVEATQHPQPAGYCVDDLIIDLGRRRVTRGPAEISLPGLSFDLLLALVRGAPNLLSTEQLMDRVWPGVVVNPETVSQRIKLVRAALGDDPQAPRYIASVRGRGYRLLPPVVLLSPRVLTSGIAGSPKGADSSATTPPLRDSQNAVPAEPTARWRRAASAVAAIALLVAGAAAVLTQMRYRDATRSSAVERPSLAQSTRTIAVLPFVNAAGDPELEYLSDRLTEELLERLSGVPELQVAARTSSFYFKNRADDVQQAGRMLRVGHVVKGSVRRQGENIRVTVELVSAENGYRHWSNEYDRHISEIVAIEQEIVHSVVDSLRLGPIQRERAVSVRSSRSTPSPEAHELYLRARHLYQSFQLDRMDKAISYYEEAIRLDPTFAAAYVGLADALGWRRLVGGMPSTDPVTARIAALLRKALDLDPSSGDAHALLGKELMFVYDFKGAERELQQAEALSPNGDYVVASIMAYYMLAGWPAERAIDYARKGRQLDPLNPWAVIHVAQAHWHAHQYDEALIELERVFEIEPDFWLAHVWRATILTDLERYREALPAARRAVELSEGPGTLSALAVAHINLGEIDEAHAVIARLEAYGATKGWDICLALKDYQCALADLEQTFAERDRHFPELLHYRAMLPLHGEPRFQRLVRLLGQERRVEQAAGLNQL